MTEPDPDLEMALCDASPTDCGESAAPDALCACLWCGIAFQPRTDGGTAQRFCKPSCRRAFDQASRAWVRRQVDDGCLSVADLRDGLGTARAAPRGKSASGRGEVSLSLPASPAPLPGQTPPT